MNHFTVNFDDDGIVNRYFNGSPQPETIVVSEGTIIQKKQ